MRATQQLRVLRAVVGVLSVEVRVLRAEVGVLRAVVGVLRAEERVLRGEVGVLRAVVGVLRTLWECCVLCESVAC